MNIKKATILLHCCFSLLSVSVCNSALSQNTGTISPRHRVTLPEAHTGDLVNDTRLLDSYEILPGNVRQFYLDARAVFSGTENADFTDSKISGSAKKNGIQLMGGPMLGNLKEDGIIIMLRPSSATRLVVKVTRTSGGDERIFVADRVKPGMEERIIIDGLSPGTDYRYAVFSGEQEIANGNLKTAPTPGEKSVFRLAFGSCFHKIGLHNPNLANQILKREPHAMALIGDIAVDDREANISMHRSDYLLRDVSRPWQNIAANVPLYSAWDDHDYLNNDLRGIPARFNKADREALRAVWRQNWNNPVNEREGIYFNTRIGPVELIMLDTRSCSIVEKRGEYCSYLGFEQQKWLKDVLLKSAAPFKVISSGTMWSDYITSGKDSWGTWDTLGREEIFNLVEKENITGVLLISGDRHGARSFKIKRPSEFTLYEFEAASLGGVPGPEAIAKDSDNQLFGYNGTDVIAFGEFTFDTTGDKPLVVFRLIDELGNILEEHSLPYSLLTPSGR
jgi:alkaline phosphatase D